VVRERAGQAVHNDEHARARAHWTNLGVPDQFSTVFFGEKIFSSKSQTENDVTNLGTRARTQCMRARAPGRKKEP